MMNLWLSSTHFNRVVSVPYYAVVICTKIRCKCMMISPRWHQWFVQLSPQFPSPPWLSVGNRQRWRRRWRWWWWVSQWLCSLLCRSELACIIQHQLHCITNVLPIYHQLASGYRPSALVNPGQMSKVKFQFL